MNIGDIPTRFGIPWASSAPGTNIVNPIPVLPQPLGHASFTEGFGPVNSTPIAGGGIPPWGADENGILFMLTASERWTQAGGPPVFNGAFSTAIGGYPRGAVVSSGTVAGRYWICLVDANPSNPDAAGANWAQWGSYVTYMIVTPGAGTTTVPDFCSMAFIECWGGGGGGSGGAGGSGGGGEYAGAWYPVVPGASVSYTVGSGGVGAANTATAGSGVLTQVLIGANLLTAFGGGGAAAGGIGQGGTGGQGGSIHLQGANGMDIDGAITFAASSPGQAWVAIGGAAQRGGAGGSLNWVGASIDPTAPGGGGGANINQLNGQAGAAGGVFLAFRIGP